jgi:hypothetical protein
MSWLFGPAPLEVWPGSVVSNVVDGSAGSCGAGEGFLVGFGVGSWWFSGLTSVCGRCGAGEGFMVGFEFGW